MRTSSIRGRRSEFQKLKLAFECCGLILQAADFTFYEVRFCKLAARALFLRGVILSRLCGAARLWRAKFYELARRRGFTD